MESLNDEDDLKLIKASAGLLKDLEVALPKLLWKPSRTGSRGRVHSQVKRRDLTHVINLIEPFQGEPQLLDARLKQILPPIVDAYIESLQTKSVSERKEHVDFQSAICVILYTLCKVRGYKVVLGFLNNEPRYLEQILLRLEATALSEDSNQSEWQVPYVLLLWLSHLLLTPFDLASISDTQASGDIIDGVILQYDLPPIALRILNIGIQYLSSPTKAQDAAAMLLVRLVTRPDMQKLDLADAVVSRMLQSLHKQTSDAPLTIYEQIGPLRFLAGIANSAELGHLIPKVYHACERLAAEENSPVVSNAVAKKIILKIFRNTAILSLRSASTEGPLLSFLQTTAVIEDVIDYLLRSLGDRDTPVRFAGAKAVSLIVLELDSAMGYEVIQAVLDTFKEDMPQDGRALDFRTANALKWHGLTLALAHMLFKRSASPSQLPDIVTALISALQFEQRAATGSSVGTNVRDAGNFGIWSLSRRYTTAELLMVDTASIETIKTSGKQQTVIECLAIQLILSACLDPAGNIRRGSSAALQELIGRHPNWVREGIKLVQIIDYQAVGLRNRAMVDVACRAAELHEAYWTALTNAALGWRGIGSADVPSRESAATLLSIIPLRTLVRGSTILLGVMNQIKQRQVSDAEGMHGLILSLAFLFKEGRVKILPENETELEHVLEEVLELAQVSIKDLSSRVLRSDLPSAVAKFIAAICESLFRAPLNDSRIHSTVADRMETLTERLLARHEDSIRRAVPDLVLLMFTFKRKHAIQLGCIGAQTLRKKVSMDGTKSTLHGANRALALGVLAPLYVGNLSGEMAQANIHTLGELMHAMNVDWRIISVRAIQLAVETIDVYAAVDATIEKEIVQAVHQGLNDYTIDERGDVGSLVRLQAISCTNRIFASPNFEEHSKISQILHADIYRLSLEKLDRVRLDAAQCSHDHLDSSPLPADVASVSSYLYFIKKLEPLTANGPEWQHTALLEGCVSCAGISAEPLLQASRAALVHLLNGVSQVYLTYLLSMFVNILKSQVLENSNSHSTLELLAFLLDMHIPQRLAESDFKWRNLLSTIQKSHHKSNDIPKILAAVRVYRGLADISSIRNETMKKLISMLKTNPYPKVRVSVAETLFVTTKEDRLKSRDWTKPASQHLEVIEYLQQCYVEN